MRTKNQCAKCALSADIPAAREEHPPRSTSYNQTADGTREVRGAGHCPARAQEGRAGPLRGWPVMAEQERSGPQGPWSEEGALLSLQWHESLSISENCQVPMTTVSPLLGVHPALVIPPPKQGLSFQLNLILSLPP